MNNNKLHIVSLDVPYPPDYGAMIDVYYRCKALKESGISIVLHCFEYGRGEYKEWHKIADEIHYYERKRSIWDVFSIRPFIVQSRRSTLLLEHLLQDNAPILFEGQHCCHLLNHPSLKQRNKMVRIHNIEWQYYDLLAKRTKSIVKKLFFKLESYKLRRFDKILSQAAALFCVSQADQSHYNLQHKKAVLMPSSSSFERAETTTQRKPYSIYHANLSVPENEEAALWILEAFNHYSIDNKLIIAGKNPSKKLVEKVKDTKNCELFINPEHSLMNQLVTEANVQLLITFQASGIKLKLINSLVQGGFCIANQQMVKGTDLGQFCEMVTIQEELIQAIHKASNQLNSTFEERNEFMNKYYDPRETCKRVIESLFV